MSDPTPAREQEKIWVRLPDGMRDRIIAAAKANGRSANTEVVARLEASFAEPELDPDVARRAAEVAERIVARVVERIEREPLPLPRVVLEQQKPESRLSSDESITLGMLRDEVGAENVDVVEERYTVARVRDPLSGAVSERRLGLRPRPGLSRLDLDVAIVRRALGRDDADVPTMQGRVVLSLLPIEPMTRMMLATLLGYVDLDGAPTAGASGAEAPKSDLLTRLGKFGMSRSDEAVSRTLAGSDEPRVITSGGYSKPRAKR